jgi:uncharacterized membrane protein YdjX (TVP38/TMEM64 family)
VTRRRFLIIVTVLFVPWTVVTTVLFFAGSEDFTATGVVANWVIAVILVALVIAKVRDRKED